MQNETIKLKTELSAREHKIQTRDIQIDSLMSDLDPQARDPAVLVEKLTNLEAKLEQVSSSALEEESAHAHTKLEVIRLQNGLIKAETKTKSLEHDISDLQTANLTTQSHHAIQSFSSVHYQVEEKMDSLQAQLDTALSAAAQANTERDHAHGMLKRFKVQSQTNQRAAMPNNSMYTSPDSPIKNVPAVRACAPLQAHDF